MEFDINAYINDLQSGSGFPAVNYKPIFEADYESAEAENKKLVENNEHKIEKIVGDISYFKTPKENLTDLFLGLMRVSNKFAAQTWSKISVLLDESINKGVVVIDSYEYLLLPKDIALFHSIIVSSSALSIVPYQSDRERCVIIIQYDFLKENDKIYSVFSSLQNKMG